MIASGITNARARPKSRYDPVGAVHEQFCECVGIEWPAIVIGSGDHFIHGCWQQVAYARECALNAWELIDRKATDRSGHFKQRAHHTARALGQQRSSLCVGKNDDRSTSEFVTLAVAHHPLPPIGVQIMNFNTAAHADPRSPG